MIACLETVQLKVIPANLASRKPPIQFLNLLLYEETGELMEMRHLMKSPKYRKILVKSYGNELGRLAQGMPGRVEGNNTIIFINIEQIPIS